jgi:hypothetical protein
MGKGLLGSNQQGHDLGRVVIRAADDDGDGFAFKGGGNLQEPGERKGGGTFDDLVFFVGHGTQGGGDFGLGTIDEMVDDGAGDGQGDGVGIHAARTAIGEGIEVGHIVDIARTDGGGEGGRGGGGDAVDLRGRVGGFQDGADAADCRARYRGCRVPG